MLASARIQTLVWTADKARAQAFYTETLGLPYQGESFGALLYRIGNGELRVSPVPSTTPSEHTVLGFAVDNLDEIADELGRRGLTAERFAGFNHDQRGVWTAPDGTKVVWFRDPDGNLLSVVQYA
jgi:catechol 2,3-dioxygenase-like lactoylglutathione lyase family enzyme